MIANFKWMHGSLDVKKLPSYILLAILFITQLLYQRIPGAYILNLLLAVGAVYLYNRKNRHMYFVYGTIIVLYIAYIFLEYRYLVDSVIAITYLLAIVTALDYISYENYTEKLKERIIRILIAAVYFGVVYLSIFLIVNLLNTLLFTNIQYSAWPFRLSNATASVLGLFVIMHDEEKSEFKHSKFFKFIVGKILPILSIMLMVLSAAVTIRYISSVDTEFILDTYPFYFGLVLLVYVLTEVADTDPRVRKALAISMAISVLIYNGYRFATIGVYRYYRLIISLLLAAWLINSIREGGKSDKKLSILAFVIALLYISPVFGYQFINKYGSLEAITEKTDSMYTMFKMTRVPIDMPIEGGDGKEFDFVYYSRANLEKKYDISKYNNIIYATLDGNKKELRTENLIVELVEHGTELEVTDSSTGKTDKYSIFDDSKRLEISPDETLEYHGDNYLITIRIYSASKTTGLSGTDVEVSELIFDLLY